MNNNFLAYYGAFVSTIVFLWKLYDEWKNRRGNLKIETNFTTQFIVLANGTYSDEEKMLTIKITNFGRSNRHIHKPTFITNSKEKKSKYLELTDLNSKIIYPKELKSGEIHIVRFPTKSFEKENDKFNKLKINVNDTFKKSYQSKWFNTENLND